MSPILDLQKSLRRLGKVRMGETRTNANGKSFPAKLEHWRITSPSAQLIEAAAAVYGGEPHTWDNPAGGGKEWEVYTETPTLRVVVPGGTYAFSQFYEMWSAGGCQRRCDGFDEQISGKACMCPADQDERQKAASKGHACKMTTRLSIVLPDIPDIGTWMLESHGYYAAVELGAAEELIRRVTGGGTPVPAHLRIEQRTAKRGNETRKYAVPVLELMTVTHDMLTTGEVSPVAIGNGKPAQISGAETRALEIGDGTQARGSRGPAPRPVTAPPQPPLPHEIEGAAPAEEIGLPSTTAAPSYDAKERAQAVARLCNEYGFSSDDDRHRLLTAFSEGAYSSSYDVPPDAVNDLRATLVRIKRSELIIVDNGAQARLQENDQGTQPTLTEQPAVVDVPLPEPDAPRDQEYWLQRAPNLKQSQLVRQAKAIGDELGVKVTTLQNVPAEVAERLEQWIGEQGS